MKRNKAMNFVFLSPNFPPNYYLFCRALKQAGFTTLAIGEPEYADLAPELAETLDWYCKVDDMHDYDQLEDACNFLTGKFGHIDGIDSLNEYWLETEARLRTRFNIDGIKTDTISEIRRKSRMKLVFEAAGVPHARGRMVNTPAEALAFAAEVRFPIIVKPDDGMGASFTYKLENPAQVEEFFATKPDREFIAEEFIAGDIVTFDGLADRNGKIVFCTSHVYDQGVMEAVLADSHIYYYSERVIPADLEVLGRKVAAAFNVRKRFFHLEFFRRSDDSLCAMEVNIRPPGGFTMDMFNYSSDVDMYSAWAEVMARGTVKLDYSRKYHSCYIGRKRHIDYARSHEEVVAGLGPMLAKYSELPEVLARAMGDSGYVIRSPDLEGIMKAVKLIQGRNA